MKKILLLIWMPLLRPSSYAQLDADNFDFWSRKWAVAWENNDGSIGHGTNHFRYVLNDNLLRRINYTKSQ